VVVLVVDAIDVLSYKDEGHSPVAAQSDRPRAAAISSERVQVKSRQVHVSRFRGHVQTAQDEPKPFRMLGLDLGSLAGGEEQLQPLVPEATDRHLGSVTRLYTGDKTLARPQSITRLVAARRAGSS